MAGLDIDRRKIEALDKGKSYIDDIEDAEVKSSVAIFTTDASVVKSADAVIVCVPTPVTEAKEPDLQPVKSAVKSIAPYLKARTLVVLESTVNPGVCDEIVIPLLEQTTGMKVGKDIYLAHCPERINPGEVPHDLNPGSRKWHVGNINRVIGANSKKELDLAVKLYTSLIDAEIKPMGSLKEAEAVKVVENSFRDINIAFVNELAMSFHKLGINVENVIAGAATKPFAFMPHHPGCGVGGHCIPVDPYYLIKYAGDNGFTHDFLKLARRINEHMPEFTVELLEEGLHEIKQTLKGAKVALLGLSYKGNVGDDRESPAYDIQKILQERGADLVTYDPFIAKRSTVQSHDKALTHADAIVVATAHQAFADSLTPKALKEAGVKIVIDGKNLLRESKQLFTAHGIIYKGIGV